MTDCFVHDKNYYTTIVLIYPKYIENSNDIVVANIVLDALDELMLIIRPLTLEISISCCHKKGGFIEYNIQPFETAFYIRDSLIPEYVQEDLISNNSQSFLVPELCNSSAINREEIIKCLRNALANNCPQPDIYRASWDIIWILNTECWLGNEHKFINAKSLKISRLGEDAVKDIPTHQHENGMWVAGAISTEMFRSPVEIIVGNDFKLKLNFNICWSLWAQPKFTAYKALVAAFNRIIKKGWEPEFLGEGFEQIGKFSE